SEELFLPGSRLSEPFRALSGPRYTRTGAKGSVGLQFSHESVLLKTHALYQWLRLVDGRFCGAPSVSAGSFPPTQGAVARAIKKASSCLQTARWRSALGLFSNRLEHLVVGNWPFEAFSNYSSS